VHEKALLLLHPLMPFLTEELWHRRGHATSIALERYPQRNASLDDADAERQMKLLQDVVTEIRTKRADRKIGGKEKLSGTIRAEGTIPHAMIEQLSNASLTVIHGAGVGFDLKLDLPEATIGEDQRERLKKDNENLEKVIANQKRQLANEDFTSKAPAKVIDGMKAKLAEYEAQLKKNLDQLV
jgi:valyl-tRNA synthetase